MAAHWLPTLILISGVIDDMRSRKIHNQLIVGLAIFTLAAQFYMGGWDRLLTGTLGLGAGLLFCLPLVLARILGAGDMKLLAVFGLASDWTSVGAVLLLSLFWGAVLGIVRAALKGELTLLLYSTASVAMRKKPPASSLQQIPYSVALFFGWLTYLTVSRLPGVSLW